jgi:hypothetical protein
VEVGRIGVSGASHQTKEFGSGRDTDLRSNVKQLCANPLGRDGHFAVCKGTPTHGRQSILNASRAFFYQLTTLLLVVASLPVAGADEARRWPNDRGEIIRADLVMVRSRDVVLRPQPYRGRLLVVPFARLRPVDRRYLDLECRHARDCGEVLEKLPQPLQDFAAIHDAATLVRAAAHSRGKSKAEVLEIFEQCVDQDWNEHLWLVAPVIFEPCPAYPDFWREDLTVLSESAWPGAWPWESTILRGQPLLLDISHGYPHSGPPAPVTRKLIAWAKERATVRSRWPVPELIPTELVNQTEVLADDRHRARYQAWRLVRHLFSLEWKVVFESSLDDERWNKLHGTERSLPPFWVDRQW